MTEESAAATATRREAVARPEEERYCDLVMKGGITSGIVYPQAVCRLAEQYQFRNVGGTSAGAIAAAAAAAAEFGRLDGAGSGFDRLEEIPDELGSDHRLLGLFQPQKQTARLHGLLIGAVRRDPGGLLGALWRYRAPAALGALPGAALTAFAFVAAIADGSPWLIAAAVVLALLCGIASMAVGAALAVAVWLLRDLKVAVVENGFGICSGMEGEAAVEPLTPWLHRTLGECSGTEGRARPLTFGDLWNAEDPEWEPREPGERRINLAMVTTNLVNRRAHDLPWEGEGWYFSPEKLGKLFPPEVVQHMVDNPRPLPAQESEEIRSLVRRGIALRQGLRPLPEAKDLPILVATRMSLSFPILLSAVPLWQFDMAWEENADLVDEWRNWGRRLADGGYLEDLKDPSTWDRHRPPEKPPVLDCCWLSDGGISSNFPVQFFDRLVPRWPTFAIDLRPFAYGEKEQPTEEDNVEPPVGRGSEASDWWYRFPKPSKKLFGLADGRLFAFLDSIVKTMQNRVDEAQMRVPGYRDRVAHVNLTKEEGGMNLDMDETTIHRIARRGEIAAQKLLAAYVPSDERGTGVSWRNQRWTRFRSSLAVLEEMAGFFATGAADPPIVGGPDSLMETAETYRLAKWQKGLAGEEVSHLEGLASAAAAATAKAKLAAGDPGGMAHKAPAPAPIGQIAPKR